MSYIPNNKKYSVYEHIFPNGKRYIGITSRKPSIRWGKNGNGYTQQYIRNAIIKYGWENIQHNILYTNLNKEDACKKEIELIKKYRTNNKQYGYNLSKGGEIPSTTLTEEALENLRKVQKKNRICIAQYSLDGIFIKTFEGIKCAEKELGIQASHITQCCKGKRQSSGGYQWRYYNNDNSNIQPYNKNLGCIGNDRRILKKIYVYDKGWYFQKESTIYEMSLELNIPQGRITQAIKTGKTYAGHKFKYIE